MLRATLLTTPHRVVRRRWGALRDIVLGLAAFITVLGLTGIPQGAGPHARGLPIELLTARALEPVSPAGFAAEYAVLDVVLHWMQRLVREPAQSEIMVLGLTFSLIFAFNLAIYRHLRRVYASPRRDGWRRGR